MDWNNLRQDYERLGSAKAVARAYGIPPAVVSYMLTEQGIPRTGTAHKGIDWSVLPELYAGGLTQVQIAERLGCNMSSVSQAMRAQGIPVRGHSNRGWKWTEREYAKRRAAVKRGAFRNSLKNLAHSSSGLNTPAERAFQQALVRARLSFETQAHVLRYWPDIRLTQKPIIVEVDSWGHTLLKDRDARRDAALEGVGYTVIRFRNEDVLADADECVRRVMDMFALEPEADPVVYIRSRRGERIASIRQKPEGDTVRAARRRAETGRNDRSRVSKRE